MVDIIDMDRKKLDSVRFGWKYICNVENISEEDMGKKFEIEVRKNIKINY